MKSRTRRCWVPATRCRVPRTLTFAGEIYDKTNNDCHARAQMAFHWPYAIGCPTNIGEPPGQN